MNKSKQNHHSTGILIAIIFVIISCVLDNDSKQSPQTGMIAPKILFNQSTSVLDIPSIVDSVRMEVTYPGGILDSTVPYNAKELEIKGIPIGEASILIQGKNFEGEILYEGTSKTTVTTTVATPTITLDQKAKLIVVPRNVNIDGVSKGFLDRDTTTSAKILLSGILVSKEEIISITWSDGITTTISDKTWEKEIHLLPGLNTITLVAQTPLGGKISESFKVYYKDINAPVISFSYPFKHVKIGTDSILIKVIVIDSSKIDSVMVNGLHAKLNLASGLWELKTQLLDTNTKKLTALAYDAWGNMDSNSIILERTLGISQDVKFSIQGVIKNTKTGNGIPNTVISLSPGNKTFTSNALGQFAFYDLPEGDYYASYTIAGYPVIDPVKIHLPNKDVDSSLNYQLILTTEPYSLKITHPGNDTSVNTNPYTIQYTTSTGAIDTTVTLHYGINDIKIDHAKSFGIDSITIELDTIKPNLPKITAQTLTSNKTPKFDWNSADLLPGAGVFKYQFSSYPISAETKEKTYTSPVLGNGTYTFKLVERDMAGNWSDTSTHTIQIDTSAPTSPTFDNSKTTKSPTNLKRPTWSWVPSGSTGLFRYALDDTSSWKDTNSTSYTPAANLSEGAHKLYIKEKNTVGNWSSFEVKEMITDYTKPNKPTLTSAKHTKTVNAVLPWTWSTASINYSFNYGIKAIENKNDTAKSYTPTTALADGIHQFYLAESDLAGNVSDTVFDTISLDQTPPLPPIFDKNIPTPSNNPTWTWKSSGGGSGDYRYTFKGGVPYESRLTSFTLPTGPETPDGTYTLTLSERDSVGNWSRDTSFSIVKKTTGPGAPIVAPFSKYPKTSPLIITWSSNTSNPGNGTFAYQFASRNGYDDTKWILTTAKACTLSINLSKDSSYTFYVREKDNLGNWGTYAYYDFGVDMTIPNKPIFDTKNDASNKSSYTWTWTSSSTDIDHYHCTIVTPIGTDSSSVYPTSYTLSGIVNGDYKLIIKAVDRANNFSAPDTAMLYARDYVYFVDQNANGTKDGNSWKNAYTEMFRFGNYDPKITEVWVTEGTYHTNDVNSKGASLQIPVGVTWRGGFTKNNLTAPTDTAAKHTILTGDLGVYGNAYTVVQLSQASTLDGFTITKGNTAGYAGGSAINFPGANDFDSATIKNSIITGNSSQFGASINTENNNYLLIENSYIYNNSGKEIYGKDGTHITLRNSTLYMDQSTDTIRIQSSGTLTAINTNFESLNTPPSIYATVKASFVNCYLDTNKITSASKTITGSVHKSNFQPTFYVNSASYNLEPTAANTNLVNRGTTLYGAPSKDMWGRGRVGLPDIGAWEKQ